MKAEVAAVAAAHGMSLAALVRELVARVAARDAETLAWLKEALQARNYGTRPASPFTTMQALAVPGCLYNCATAKARPMGTAWVNGPALWLTRPTASHQPLGSKCSSSRLKTDTGKTSAVWMNTFSTAY